MTPRGFIRDRSADWPSPGANGKPCHYCPRWARLWCRRRPWSQRVLMSTPNAELPSYTFLGTRKQR